MCVKEEGILRKLSCTLWKKIEELYRSSRPYYMTGCTRCLDLARQRRTWYIYIDESEKFNYVFLYDIRLLCFDLSYIAYFCAVKYIQISFDFGRNHEKTIETITPWQSLDIYQISLKLVED
jgi:hypothetical protein